MALSLAVIFNMTVNLFFYASKDSMHLPVVFFVVAADLADECHHHSETTTDQRNHNLNFHVMQVVSGKRFSLGLCFSLASRAMPDDIPTKVECPMARRQ